MKIRVIKYFVFFTILFLLTSTVVLAESVKLDNPLGPGVTFEILTKNLISAALGLSGVLALIAFIYGGILWMTSNGDSGKVTKGRNVIIWAVAGLVIIFSSYAILTFIFTALMGESDDSAGNPFGVPHDYNDFTD